MTREIETVPYLLTTKYSSISEAVSGVRCIEKDTNKLENINGKIVTGYRFNGHSLIFSFDNNSYLKVSIGNSSIDWDVVFEEPLMISENLDDAILFKTNGVEDFLWEWKNLLNSFIGKQIAISPSDQYLFLFVRGIGDYMFNACANKANLKEVFLYISET